MLQAQGIDIDTPPVQPGAQAGADKVVQPAAPPGLIPLTVSQRAKQTLGSGTVWRSNHTNSHTVPQLQR